MSRRNFGGFLSANEQATDSASANGIYTLSEAQQKTALGVFPTGRWTPQRSVRFKGTNSYFSRSISSLGTKFTFSCWVKRSRINSTSSSSQLFQLWNGVNGNAGLSCFFTYTGYGTADMIYLTWDTYIAAGNGYSNSMYTTSLFRDPSAWYHVVIVADTVVPTFARAFKIYVNGVQQSMTLGTEYNSWSSGLTIPGSLMNLGASNGGAGYANFYDGYWSENVFVDGQALTPSSFAFTDPETGTWVPKRYTGTYGTNGYYLPFNDATSTTTIGYDRQLGFTDTSKNNFTSTNISVTTGNTYDSMVDVPGIPSVTSQPDIGGVQRGNYCTWNPLFIVQTNSNAGSTWSNGNLQFTSGTNNVSSMPTMALPTTGKWYWEITTTAFGSSSSPGVGICDYTGLAGGSGGWWQRSNGNKYDQSGNGFSYGATWTTNDVIGVAVDMDAATLTFYKNGVSQGVAWTSITSNVSGTLLYPFVRVNVAGDIFVANFGQRPFAYTPPTGYKTLCTTNLPTPVIKRPSDHFDIKTWTGTGKAMTITNTAKQSSTHQVPRSLRFRNDQSPYLTRTLTTPTNNKIWTFSCWFKRGQLTYGASGASGALFYAPSSGSTFAGIYFTPGDLINWYDASGGATVYLLQTAQVFRDPSAWYHLICAYDSSQTDAVNRQKMYINGVQITAFASGGSSYVAQNTNGRFNSAVAHDIGRTSAAGPYYYDGYLAEVNFIDGQQLTPSSFGDFDSSNNWMAKKYTGTYGNNGFYLPFNDPTSTTTIGYDRQISLTDNSKNNFTSSGIYLTSSTAANPYDAMYDSPTDYDDGTAVRGNYATFSPQMISGSNTIDYCNLRTTCTNASGWNITSSTTQFPANGKWYCEFYIEYRGDAADRVGIVVTQPSAPIMTSSNLAGANNAYVWDYAGHTSGFYNNGTFYGSGAATYGTSDLIGMAYDGSTGSLWFGKQTGATGSMVWANSGNPATGANPAFTGLYNITPGVEGYSNAVVVANFGQRPWSATPPTGFVGLNTKSMKDSGSYNLPDNFGNFVNTADLVILRSRSSSSYPVSWYDTTRGPKQTITSDSTAVQSSIDGVSSFLPNGFELGTSTYGNNSGTTYVGWGWNKSQTPGFDVVPYSGTGSNLSVPHSLGATPKFIIVKALGTPNGSARSWFVYHADQGPSKFGYLNSTSAFQSGTTVWQGVAPDSSNFFLGTEPSVNWNGAAYIAYLWSEIPGYSKFGSYTGINSADGPFIYCGFRPRFVLFKCSSAAIYWTIVDSSRSLYNPVTGRVWLDITNLEDTGDTVCDFTSNGFKLRSTTATSNYNGQTMIYAAFAEAPFKYANAR